MVYKSFHIKNYKGIENMEVDLSDNRIITLVGLNESGKTTFMEAIKLCYEFTRGTDLSNAKINRFRPKGISFTGNILFSVTLLLEDQDRTLIKNYWKSLGKRSELIFPDHITFNYNFKFNIHTYKGLSRSIAFHVKTLNVSKKSEKVLHKSNFTDWRGLTEYIKSITPEILYFSDFDFDIPENIAFDKSTNEPDAEVWQLVLDDVLKSVDGRMSFREQVINSWDEDNDRARNCIAQMERALDDKITNHWGALFDNTNFKQIRLSIENTSELFSLSFKIQTDSHHEFSVHERSKGFKWFFSFLLFTEFRKTRTKNILFLLDEPASNLHSSAQAKILGALRELSKDALVIYSTHSHHLINPEWLDGTFICINENISKDTLQGNLSLNDGAKISAIKYFKYVGTGLGSDNVSYFQPVLDKLDYKPSTLEPIPNIIILEGKNDWYTHKYFQDIIFKKSYNLFFYPGASKDKLDNIIAIYLSWGKKFVIMLDGDDKGKAKQRYIKKYGEILESCVFSIADITAKEVELERLIGLRDQARIYDEIFGKGSYEMIKTNKKKLKENLNYAIRHLLIQEKTLKLSASTTNNFRKIFDFLEQAIS